MLLNSNAYFVPSIIHITVLYNIICLTSQQKNSLSAFNVQTKLVSLE